MFNEHPKLMPRQGGSSDIPAMQTYCQQIGLYSLTELCQEVDEA